MPIRRNSLIAGLFIGIVSPQITFARLDEPGKTSAAMTEMMRYEPTGLALLGPYERGKIPVVFIHGLWSTPWSWHQMISVLESDPSLKSRYQFWTFGYSTGDPIPYSASLLRRNLDAVRQRFDPDHADRAFDRMVIVGHSMGGLVSKMMVTDPGDRLWSVISDRPFGQLMGEQEDRDLFREGLFFAARPEVRRVVYIATPHQGSHVDRGAIQHIGTRLVRVADPLRAAHHRLIASNEPTFFRDRFRKGIPSSIDELESGSPILTQLSELATPPTVKIHSIIAIRPGLPGGDRSDGLVSYKSAHIEAAASEKLVSSGHLCQDNPEVIAEMRRILTEHLAP